MFVVPEEAKKCLAEAFTHAQNIRTVNVDRAIGQAVFVTGPCKITVSTCPNGKYKLHLTGPLTTIFVREELFNPYPEKRRRETRRVVPDKFWHTILADIQSLCQREQDNPSDLSDEIKDLCDRYSTGDRSKDLFDRFFHLID